MKGGHQIPLRLVTATDELHSVSADHIAQELAPHITSEQLYRYSCQANAELFAALAECNLQRQIAAERKLVAIGGLAQIHANHLERKSV